LPIIGNYDGHFSVFGPSDLDQTCNADDLASEAANPTPFDNQGLRLAAEIFQHLKILLQTRGFSTSVGDEGGFAPDLKSHEEAIELIMRAIQKAGYTPGRQVSLALDPAASQFYEGSRYNLASGEQTSRTSSGLNDSKFELRFIYGNGVCRFL
jgi:enolase